MSDHSENYDEEARDHAGPLPPPGMYAIRGIGVPNQYRAVTPPPVRAVHSDTALLPRPKPTPHKASALDCIRTKEGIRDPAVRQYIRDEFADKMHRGFDVREFVRIVWDFEPVNIRSTPFPTKLHPEAEFYTLPHDEFAAYYQAEELSSYEPLVEILGHLMKQLFGDTEFDAIKSSKAKASKTPAGTRRRLSDPTSNQQLQKLRPRTTYGLRGTARDASDCSELIKNAATDAQFCQVGGGYLKSNYCQMKPDLAFSTVEDRGAQHWSWLMSFGEVKKPDNGRGPPWVHAGDVIIPLQKLKEDVSTGNIHGRKRKRISLESVSPRKRPRNSLKSKAVERRNSVDSPGSEEVDETVRDIEMDKAENWRLPTTELLDRPMTRNEVQTAKYINEMLSHGMRSYGSGFFVTECKMFLWYADRMGVIVSDSFDILEEPELLLLTVAAMGAADIHTAGICPIIHFPPSTRTFDTYKDCKLVLAAGLAHDVDGKKIEEELEFDLAITDDTEIYTEFGAIGRGTTVVPIQATEKTVTRMCIEDNNLVAKIAWPSAMRDTEQGFITAVRQKLKEHKPDFLKHVVDLKCSLDLSMHDIHLPRYYTGVQVHEPRTFRTLILQRYERLEQVSSVEEFRGIFLDVVRAHHWIWETSQILHRDISVNNIMFYRKDDRTYGVLCDWDLAARRDVLSELADDVEDEAVSNDDSADDLFAPIAEADAAEAAKLRGEQEGKPEEPGEPANLKASENKETPADRPRYRTGTGPFMALDLLSAGTPLHHRYRHDLESFFFVLAYFCAVFDPTQNKLGHLIEWEDPSLVKIGHSKRDFLEVHAMYRKIYTGTHLQYLRIVKQWVQPLRALFCQAVAARTAINNQCVQLESAIIWQRPAIQNEIRRLKAWRNSIVTYKTFMACLGENVED